MASLYSVDVKTVESYARLVESGHADDDLTADERADCAAYLRAAIKRAESLGLVYPSGLTARENLRPYGADVDRIPAGSGIENTALARAREIIRNV